MLPKANNLFTQSRIARTMVRLFTIALLIGCFVMSQASVKAVTTWSDMWADDSNPDQAFIIGCGVTEATYDDDWELQSVKVTVTLRSPNGRTSILSDHTWSNRTTYSAIAEPRLNWDLIEGGNFTVSSHHYSTCPPTELGNTSELMNVSLNADETYYYKYSNDVASESAGIRVCNYTACNDINTKGSCFETNLAIRQPYEEACSGRPAYGTFRRVTFRYPFNFKILSHCVPVTHGFLDFDPCPFG